MLIEAVKNALKKSVLNPELLEVMDYAVLPAGKLFRPRLTESLALDLNGKLTPDHLHLASAVELHHAYTLVHDDLPAMDNDLVRRGKPSTHAKYGEWRAVLAGDALLIASFSELNNISHPNFRDIHKLMLWTTGAKGLIDGQYRDLGADGNLNFQEVVRIHELKTARLIQLVTLGSLYLSPKKSFQEKVSFLRLGREIGVSFQLLDDLSELTESEISEHEQSINPFITGKEESLKELRNSHQRLIEVIYHHKLKYTQKMLQEYFLANQENLLKNFSMLEKNMQGDLKDLKTWITSFV